MDFNDTPEQTEFRTAAKAWLAERAPAFEGAYQTQEEGLERACRWQQSKYDAGWACIRWPKEYGGQGGSAVDAIIFDQEEAAYDLPRGFLLVGRRSPAPTRSGVSSSLSRVPGRT